MSAPINTVVAAYPDQLMLPGQTAAPGGPVDMTVMYLMHHAFRRDLRKFAAAVPHTPADEVATWIALAERWGRFGEVLHHHHSGEDAGIWPFLLERCSAEERATLLAMEAEHADIDPVLTACGELFGALAGTGAGERSREELRAALSVRLAEARELLAQHLRHEETETLVILQRLMTQEQWEEIEKEHFGEKKGDVKYLLYVVPWLAEELPADVFDEVLTEAGRPMRVIHWLGKRSFRKLEDRAFRHLP